MVGDPSGKSAERNLQTDEMLAANLAGIVPQLRQFLDFGENGSERSNPAKLLDNRAWTVGVSFLDFLRDVGKHVTVSQMMAKESVRNRLDSEPASRITEFSYMLLQAHDFSWLNEHEGCDMQMGGSDQWGNITLGARSDPSPPRAPGARSHLAVAHQARWIEVRQDRRRRDHVVERGARMSPYRFYQAWIQTDDGEVGQAAGRS